MSTHGELALPLAEEQSLCVCDLSEILGMTVPAVSQHLKKLRGGRQAAFMQTKTLPGIVTVPAGLKLAIPSILIKII